MAQRYGTSYAKAEDNHRPPTTKSRTRCAGHKRDKGSKPPTTKIVSEGGNSFAESKNFYLEYPLEEVIAHLELIGFVVTRLEEKQGEMV